MNETCLFWQGEGWGVRVLYSSAGVATSILVTSKKGGSLLMDAGDGTLRDLVSLNCDFRSLSAVLISHGHFDHIGGIHSLLGFMQMIGRSEELVIAMPKGAREPPAILDAFESLYSNTMPFKVVRHEVEDSRSLKFAEIIIKSFKVVHSGSTSQGIGQELPAVGYELFFANQRIVYTGDAGLGSNLEPRINGADLLLIEATLDKPGGESERRVHLSLESSERLARLAKRAFIIHRGRGKEPLDIQG